VYSFNILAFYLNRVMAGENMVAGVAGGVWAARA